jgi:hypothetical protein
MKWKYLFFILFIFFSCRKDGVSSYVGIWKGVRTEETFLNGSRLTNYSDDFFVELKEDNTGTYNDDIIRGGKVHWYLDEKNKKFFISVFNTDSLFGSQFTDFLFDIKKDENNAKTWERIGNKNTRIQFIELVKVVERWELKK